MGVTESHSAAGRSSYSAGILLFRRRPGVEVLIAHMGGPYWAGKDEGGWSIPKGEHGPEEDPLVAARREFAEELGTAVPGEQFVPLGELRQPGGKRVSVWAVEGDLDATAITSNTFALEWPPRSGRLRQFPEVDRAGWFDVPTARTRLVKGQRAFLDALASQLGIAADADAEADADPGAQP